MQIHLIRHGETTWSRSGQHTGHTELDLTAVGEAQAQGLLPVLQGIDFDRVLSSPRLRARRTCALSGLGRAVEIEPDLSEWNYGAYEGLRTTDIQQERPAWNVWRDGCPDGEMPADVSARADRLIRRLRQLQGPVALFSHGQFGAALAARWIGLPLLAGQHFALHPASLSLLGEDPNHAGRRVIGLWNQTASSCGAPQTPQLSVRQRTDHWPGPVLS
jgi:probable phosphoglycerate mutase